MTRILQQQRWPLVAWAVLLLCLGLASAALAYGPTQADQGAQVYSQRCSTCHGDVGQGLTDEFRATWAPGDQNCWVPACHGPNHPRPGGFSIPRQVPALVGPGTLTAFANAQELHAFIRTKMPMQEPGVLSNDDYWALTAFLLRANGVAPDGRLLNDSTASGVVVPRSGQPVPKPDRSQSTERRMPANSPGSFSDSSPNAPALTMTSNQVGASTAAVPGQTSPSAATPMASGAVWTIALGIALATAAVAVTWANKKAPR